MIANTTRLEPERRGSDIDLIIEQRQKLRV